MFLFAVRKKRVNFQPAMFVCYKEGFGYLCTSNWFGTNKTQYTLGCGDPQSECQWQSGLAWDFLSPKDVILVVTGILNPPYKTHVFLFGI